MMILQQLDLARSSICLAIIIVVSFMRTAASQQRERVNVCGGNGPPSNGQLNENVAAGTVVLKNKVTAGAWWEFEMKQVYPLLQNQSLYLWALSILKFRPVEAQNSSRCGFSGSGNESFCELYVSKSIDFEEILAEFHEAVAYLAILVNIKCRDELSREVSYQFTMKFRVVDEYPTTFPSADVTISLPLHNMTAGQTIFTLVPKDEDSISAESKFEFLQEVTMAPLDELFQFTVDGEVRMLRNATADDFPGNTPRVYTLTKDNATMTISIQIPLMTGESVNVSTANTTEDPVGATGHTSASTMNSVAAVSLGLAGLAFIAGMAVALFLGRKGTNNTAEPKPKVRRTSRTSINRAEQAASAGSFNPEVRRTSINRAEEASYNPEDSCVDSESSIGAESSVGVESSVAAESSVAGQ